MACEDKTIYTSSSPSALQKCSHRYLERRACILQRVDRGSSCQMGGRLHVARDLTSSVTLGDIGYNNYHTQTIRIPT